LHLGSIDSYRVKLNNPKSILEELKYCLEEFELGRIKHFQTIKAKEKDKKALVDDAIKLLAQEPNYLQFTSISAKYITQVLNELSEHNYKRVISILEILLTENSTYLETVADGLEVLISSNNHTLENLEKLDNTLSYFFSELISNGYSKGFLYKLVYGAFVFNLKSTIDFNINFASFKARILEAGSAYDVIFKIDTTQKVYDAITAIPHSVLILTDDINAITITGKLETEFNSFNTPAVNRKFITCNLIAKDPFAALKKARNILSEYLDVLNLGLSDENLQINHRVFILGSRANEKGGFLNNINVLDGKYKVEMNHYFDFTTKLPQIIQNTNIIKETKEKIKSAIRYLRLGNQSTEVEHKFINYWIGLEYLFSNYDSLSTINRLKEHFINAHLLAYVKRNVYSLNKTVSRLSNQNLALITAFTTTDQEHLKTIPFYDQIIANFTNDFPLLAYRAMKLKKWFFKGDKPANATDYLNYHRINLEIHFTRIYRLRNEIIHDAATDTNNEQIASNLRYYLTFILNELIDFLSDATNSNTTIEDYFILNEIKIGNIAFEGYLLVDLLEVECSIDFIS
jgi:sulfur transfer complex TusBCD TusB component (DsrH family)